MKKLALSALTTLLFLADCQCQITTADCWVVAHRGDWRNYPENSLEAIESAIKMRVDMVEIDVQKTKDGHLILMHDLTVDRTTNGTGKVKDLTLQEIKQLHLKNGLGRTTIFKVPTLEEAMLVVKDKVWINLDKSYNYFEEALEVLRKTKTLDQTVMKSKKNFSQIVDQLDSLFFEINFMPIVFLDKPGAKPYIEGFKEAKNIWGYEFIFETDTSQVLEELNSLAKGGKRIWVNSLWSSLCAGMSDDLAQAEPDSAWGKLLDMGFNTIQTDRPKQLSNYLRHP